MLNSSKLKEFADDNFKFDENGRKFSKWLENTLGKGEIARSEQFLLFPPCFQKTCTADTWKAGIVWERVKNLKPESWLVEYKCGGHSPPDPLHTYPTSKYTYIISEVILKGGVGFEFSVFG